MHHYDHEAESAVLNHLAQSSCLSVQEAADKLQRSGLVKGDFHSPAHASFFEAAQALVNETQQPIDPLTVKAYFDKPGGLAPIGGLDGILKLVLGNSHLSDSSFTSYAEKLRSMAARRHVVSSLREVLGRMDESASNPERMLSELHAKLASVIKSGEKYQSLKEVMDLVTQEYDQRQLSENPAVVPTGIAALDEIIGGWQPTLNLLGALPGVGKSAVIASSVRAIATAGKRVGVVSLEDEASFLGWRLWSHESDVDHFVLKFLKVSEKSKAKADTGLDKMDVYWDNVLLRDGSDSLVTIDALVADCHAMILNHGVEIIFIDHLGEISNKGTDRYDLEVAEHLSALRRVANCHQVPVVVAAHLRRRNGQDTDAAPTLQDFANSAGAERKARVAIGLSRAQDSDVITFHVLKNTNGKAGYRVDAHFHGASAMLTTAEDAEKRRWAANESLWDKHTGKVDNG